MQTMQDARTTQGDIWVRLVQPGNGNFPKDAARGILALNFTEQDKARMDELAHKNNQGKLSAAEREELESYILVGDVLSLLHLKARKSLKR